MQTVRLSIWRHVFGILIGLALVPFPSAEAQEKGNLAAAKPTTGSERRVALVIGNSDYKAAPLKNPQNDANDVARKLRDLGFDVVERVNLKTSQIGRTLREFRSKLTPGTVALVFYAGHGLQIKGENYLPTIDAEIEGEEDVPNQSMGVRQLLDLLDESKTSLNLVFLDACRNNPYARNFRSAGDGLARLNAPSGTLISFATRPGSVAADGSGRNGLYTTHLLAAMDAPNLPVEQVLKKVVSAVRTESKGRQEPWMEGSIEGEFYFRREVVATAPAVDQKAAIDRAVAEAISRANEQSAKERADMQAQSAKDKAELQASMEKMLQQAMARQNAIIEAQRAGQSASAPRPTPEPASASAQLRPSAQSPSPRIAPPVTLAAVSPTLSPPSPGESAADIWTRKPRPGDEWAYVAKDNLTKASRKLALRVRSVDVDGIREDVLLNGRESDSLVFNGKAAMAAVRVDSEFMFAPHWESKESGSVDFTGTNPCASYQCSFTAKVTGREKITVAAGTFDTLKIEGGVTKNNYSISGLGSVSGSLTVWYEPKSGRVIRQQAQVRGGTYIPGFDEVIELQSARSASGSTVPLTATPLAVPLRVESLARSPQPGDEWEYSMRDGFGKKQTLMLRVKAVAAETGVLESILLNGRPALEWVFDGKASLVGMPVESEFIFSPHWDGSEFAELEVSGANRCAQSNLVCTLRAKRTGKERITVPAGTFDTIRIEGHVYRRKLGSIGATTTTVSGPFTLWYSEAHQRVIKQEGSIYSTSGSAMPGFSETVELTAVRTVPR